MADFEKGLETRRAVLGDAHVDRSMKNRSDFDAKFQEMIVESAWHRTWTSDAISKRERSMVTLAILAALGREEEFILHLNATINTGASRDDIRETLMHVAIYAGVPAANTAFRIAKQVYAKIDEEAAS